MSIADDSPHMNLDPTTIKGQHGLPRVLHIVPWKRASAGELSAPTASLIDDALAPLYRPEFRREVQYHQDMAAYAAPNPGSPMQQQPQE